jgi:hypothetical protein
MSFCFGNMPFLFFLIREDIFFKTYLFHRKTLLLQKYFKLNMSTKTDAQTIGDITVMVKGIRDNREVLLK